MRRLEVAPFNEDDFVTLAELEAAWPPLPPKSDDDEVAEAAPAEPRDFSALDEFIIDTGAALEDLVQVALSDDQAHRVRMGNPVILRGRDAPLEADEVCANHKNRLLAIGFIEQGMFKPKRVFTC